MPSLSQKVSTLKQVQEIHTTAMEKLREVEYVYADGLTLVEAWALFHNTQVATKALARSLNELSRQIQNNQ